MYEAKPGEVDHILLLYSGGLDTSAIILWLKENYECKVSTLTVDLGQGEDLIPIKVRAEEYGADNSIIIDCKEEFVSDYISKGILANGLYFGIYPMATSLGRPLLGIKAVEFAKKLGAKAIAHGSTGKGNDQVRKEMTILAKDPKMKIVAPVRSYKLSREEEKALMKKHGHKVPNTHKAYSVDENLWGISFQGSELSDPKNEASNKVYEFMKNYFPSFNKPEDAPDAQTISIGFEDGLPISLDGKKMKLLGIIEKLNKLGAKHGIGIIDYVESYIFGHKGREFYLAPAAKILISAHKDLEYALLPKTLLHKKMKWDLEWSYQVYHGLWLHDYTKELTKLIESVNKGLDGVVKLKLYKGSVSPVSRSSPKFTKFMYSEELGKTGFDELSSAGFIDLFGLEMRL